jgi:hypothetical protein
MTKHNFSRTAIHVQRLSEALKRYYATHREAKEQRKQALREYYTTHTV